MLGSGEVFTRSWTISNTSTSSAKEKGKVAKLVHCKGYVLTQQLLFLWPLPGKSVTVNMELTAPQTPGWYESYWRMDGKEEADFWVKFEVIPDDNPEPLTSRRPSSSAIVQQDPEKKAAALEMARRATMGDITANGPHEFDSTPLPDLNANGEVESGESEEDEGTEDEAEKGEEKEETEESVEKEMKEEAEEKVEQAETDEDKDEDEDGDEDEEKAKSEEVKVGEVANAEALNASESDDADEDGDSVDGSAKEAVAEPIIANEGSAAPAEGEKSEGGSSEKEEAAGDSTVEQKGEAVADLSAEQKGEEEATEAEAKANASGEPAEEEGAEADVKGEVEGQDSRSVAPAADPRSEADTEVETEMETEVETEMETEVETEMETEVEKSQGAEGGEKKKQKKKKKHKKSKKTLDPELRVQKTLDKEKRAARREAKRSRRLERKALLADGEEDSERSTSSRSTSSKSRKRRKSKKSRKYADVAAGAAAVPSVDGEDTPAAEAVQVMEGARAVEAEAWKKPLANEEALKDLMFNPATEAGKAAKVSAVKVRRCASSTDQDEDEVVRAAPGTESKVNVGSKWSAAVNEQTAVQRKEIEAVKKRELLDRQISVKSLTKKRLTAFARLADDKEDLPDTSDYPLQRRSSIMQVDAMMKGQLAISSTAALVRKLQVTLDNDAFHSYDGLKELTQQCNSQLEALQSTFQKMDEEISRITFQKSSIGCVPDDLWVRIFSFLSPKDLCNMSLVSKNWNALASSDDVWLPLHLALRGKKEFARSKTASGFSAKHMYQVDYLYKRWFTRGRIWEDVTEGSYPELGEVDSGSWPVFDLAVAGDLLVSASDRLHFFDLAASEAKGSITGHEKVVTCVEMTASGAVCVSGSVDQTVRVWDVASKECSFVLSGHESGISSLGLIGQCAISAVTGEEEPVRLWDITTGALVHEIKRKGTSFHTVATNSSRDDGVIYMSGSNGTVMSWDLQGQRETKLAMGGLTGSVDGLSVHGSLLAAADGAQLVVTDLRTNTSVMKADHLGRSIRRLCLDECRLGVQLGNCLDVYDLRYLYNMYSSITLSALWKGAFAFRTDGVVVGGGDGSLSKWEPQL